MSPKAAKAKPKRYWPAGFKVINGKRVYPDEKKAPVIPAPPRMKQVNLDSGLPPSHPRNTPAITPRLEGEQPLFELPEVIEPAKKIPPSDFVVLSGAISILTTRLEAMHNRLLEVETKPAPGSDAGVFVRVLRARCVETSSTGTHDLRNFARSLVDLIDEFTNQLPKKEKT